jgi:protein TonB
MPAFRPEYQAAEAKQAATQSDQAKVASGENAQGGAVGGEAEASRGASGTGAGVGVGDLEGPGDEYLERVRRWLAKHKKYPAEARKRKQEGSVVVEFVLARDGAVLDAQIERSSGFPLIDEAALDMLQRASPVPPVPPAYRGERLRIAIPVRFSLGFFERLL